MPGELGDDGRPPLAQRRAGGRGLPGPLGHQRTDRRSETRRLASVAPHRTDRPRFLLRLLAAAILACRFLAGHLPGEEDP